MPYAGVTIVRKDFFIAVGQYVKRNGKTYYKGDDGKLYKDYSTALAVANRPQTGFEYGLSLLGIRPDRNQPSGLQYGMSQLSGLAGTPGKPETGLQYGLQQAGKLFNSIGRSANASGRAPTDAELLAEGYRPLSEEFSAARNKRQIFPAAPVLPPPVVISAGTVQPGAITKGVTSSGELDYSQGDEYKSQMAQYRNLINQKKTQEAEDLGMQIWMQKYGNSPMGQAGGFIGAKNPLLAATFPETGGYASTFAPVEDYQMGEFGTRAQGETGYTMESLNPLQAQAQQQAATAAQADKATTAGVKIPVRNRVQAFLYGGM